ncbi:putative Serine/threonine-protein kinase CTR1 [Paratrimastix pyriformis]|uniref:Serine/threonine-protein kinase CTR1 n=1 Tax=Paratrimastix pyriformis TaxID=342808 RepID=A0ABQ8US01_9EUKA|nr:putative Serine/threonine-protein kinase CTR1 [Paratrimastix pyriformis]
MDANLPHSETAAGESPHPFLTPMKIDHSHLPHTFLRQLGIVSGPLLFPNVSVNCTCYNCSAPGVNCTVVDCASPTVNCTSPTVNCTCPDDFNDPSVSYAFALSPKGLPIPNPQAATALGELATSFSMPHVLLPEEAPWPWTPSDEAWPELAPMAGHFYRQNLTALNNLTMWAACFRPLDEPCDTTAMSKHLPHWAVMTLSRSHEQLTSWAAEGEQAMFYGIWASLRKYLMRELVSLKVAHTSTFDFYEVRSCSSIPGQIYLPCSVRPGTAFIGVASAAHFEDDHYLHFYAMSDDGTVIGSELSMQEFQEAEENWTGEVLGPTARPGLFNLQDELWFRSGDGWTGFSPADELLLEGKFAKVQSFVKTFPDGWMIAADWVSTSKELYAGTEVWLANYVVDHVRDAASRHQPGADSPTFPRGITTWTDAQSLTTILLTELIAESNGFEYAASFVDEVNQTYFSVQSCRLPWSTEDPDCQAARKSGRNFLLSVDPRLLPLNTKIDRLHASPALYGDVQLRAYAIPDNASLGAAGKPLNVRPFEIASLHEVTQPTDGDGWSPIFLLPHINTASSILIRRTPFGVFSGHRLRNEPPSLASVLWHRFAPNVVAALRSHAGELVGNDTAQFFKILHRDMKLNDNGWATTAFFVQKGTCSYYEVRNCDNVPGGPCSLPNSTHWIGVVQEVPGISPRYYRLNAEGAVTSEVPFSTEPINACEQEWFSLRQGWTFPSRNSRIYVLDSPDVVIGAQHHPKNLPCNLPAQFVVNELVQRDDLIPMAANALSLNDVQSVFQTLMTIFQKYQYGYGDQVTVLTNRQTAYTIQSCLHQDLVVKPSGPDICQILRSAVGNAANYVGLVRNDALYGPDGRRRSYALGGNGLFTKTGSDEPLFVEASPFPIDGQLFGLYSDRYSRVWPVAAPEAHGLVGHISSIHLHAEPCMTWDQMPLTQAPSAVRYLNAHLDMPRLLEDPSSAFPILIKAMMIFGQERSLYLGNPDFYVESLSCLRAPVRELPHCSGSSSNAPFVGRWVQPAKFGDSQIRGFRLSTEGIPVDDPTQPAQVLPQRYVHTERPWYIQQNGWTPRYQSAITGEIAQTFTLTTSSDLRIAADRFLDEDPLFRTDNIDRPGESWLIDAVRGLASSSVTNASQLPTTGYVDEQDALGKVFSVLLPAMLRFQNGFEVSLGVAYSNGQAYRVRSCQVYPEDDAGCRAALEANCKYIGFITNTSSGVDLGYLLNEAGAVLRPASGPGLGPSQSAFWSEGSDPGFNRSLWEAPLARGTQIYPEGWLALANMSLFVNEVQLAHLSHYRLFGAHLPSEPTAPSACSLNSLARNLVDDLADQLMRTTWVAGDELLTLTRFTRKYLSPELMILRVAFSGSYFAVINCQNLPLAQSYVGCSPKTAGSWVGQKWSPELFFDAKLRAFLLDRLGYTNYPLDQATTAEDFDLQKQRWYTVGNGWTFRQVFVSPLGMGQFQSYSRRVTLKTGAVAVVSADRELSEDATCTLKPTPSVWSNSALPALVEHALALKDNLTSPTLGRGFDPIVFGAMVAVQEQSQNGYASALLLGLDNNKFWYIEYCHTTLAGLCAWMQNDNLLYVGISAENEQLRYVAIDHQGQISDLSTVGPTDTLAIDQTPFWTTAVLDGPHVLLDPIGMSDDSGFVLQSFPFGRVIARLEVNEPGSSECLGYSEVIPIVHHLARQDLASVRDNLTLIYPLMLRSIKAFTQGGMIHLFLAFRAPVSPLFSITNCWHPMTNASSLCQTARSHYIGQFVDTRKYDTGIRTFQLSEDGRPLPPFSRGDEFQFRSELWFRQGRGWTASSPSHPALAGSGIVRTYAASAGPQYLVAADRDDEQACSKTPRCPSDSFAQNLVGDEVSLSFPRLDTAAEVYQQLIQLRQLLVNAQNGLSRPSLEVLAFSKPFVHCYGFSFSTTSRKEQNYLMVLSCHTSATFQALPACSTAQLFDASYLGYARVPAVFYDRHPHVFAISDEGDIFPLGMEPEEYEPSKQAWYQAHDGWMAVQPHLAAPDYFGLTAYVQTISGAKLMAVQTAQSPCISPTCRELSWAHQLVIHLAETGFPQLIRAAASAGASEADLVAPLTCISNVIAAVNFGQAGIFVAADRKTGLCYTVVNCWNPRYAKSPACEALTSNLTTNNEPAWLCAISPTNESRLWPMVYRLAAPDGLPVAVAAIRPTDMPAPSDRLWFQVRRGWGPARGGVQYFSQTLDRNGGAPTNLSQTITLAADRDLADPCPDVPPLLPAFLPFKVESPLNATVGEPALIVLGWTQLNGLTYPCDPTRPGLAYRLVDLAQPTVDLPVTWQCKNDWYQACWTPTVDQVHTLRAIASTDDRTTRDLPPIEIRHGALGFLNFTWESAAILKSSYFAVFTAHDAFGNLFRCRTDAPESTVVFTLDGAPPSLFHCVEPGGVEYRVEWPIVGTQVRQGSLVAHSLDGRTVVEKTVNFITGSPSVTSTIIPPPNNQVVACTDLAVHVTARDEFENVLLCNDATLRQFVLEWEDPAAPTRDPVVWSCEQATFSARVRVRTSGTFHYSIGAKPSMWSDATWLGPLIPLNVLQGPPMWDNVTLPEVVGIRTARFNTTLTLYDNCYNLIVPTPLAAVTFAIDDVPVEPLGVRSLPLGVTALEWPTPSGLGQHKFIVTLNHTQEHDHYSFEVRGAELPWMAWLGIGCGGVTIVLVVPFVLLIVRWHRFRREARTWRFDKVVNVDFKNLKLLQKIGGGASGEVHKADLNGTIVAAKFLRDDSPDQMKQYEQEVALLRTLRHPHVVALIGATRQCIVTEYLENGSLDRLLVDPSLKLSVELRLQMALDMARGLCYLHLLRPPLFHRDIKSPNMLVTADMRVKVADFGISRLSEEHKAKTTGCAGTVAWASPEILRNDRNSWLPADVYSFGVVLWELVTRQVPWSGQTTAVIIDGVANKGRRLQLPPEQDCPFPPSLLALIRQCWCENPTDRPSMPEVLEVLNEEAKKHPYLPQKGGRRKAKRHQLELLAVGGDALQEQLLPPSS